MCVCVSVCVCVCVCIEQSVNAFIYIVKLTRKQLAIRQRHSKKNVDISKNNVNIIVILFPLGTFMSQKKRDMI